MYRSASGLSAAKLAAKVGVSQGSLSKYENPEYDMFPSFEVLVRLAEVLNAPLGDLAGVDVPGPGTPQWVHDLMPDLARLDVAGQESVKALVKGLKR